MAGTKEIKRRIKSVKNTKKITKAMELVAASKMKRAVASTLSSRLYADYSWEVLTSISKNVDQITNPLFLKRPVNNTLLIIITSNRGLCGAYNAQVIKRVISLLKELPGASVVLDNNKEIILEKTDIVSIGKKGDNAMRRTNQNVIASFLDLPDNIKLSDTIPISKLILDQYSLENYDQVLIAYTDFVSALTQKPNVKQILPITKSAIEELFGTSEEMIATPDQNINYLFEGDKDLLLNSLAEKITRMQIYQAVLESNASEQSSRMVAMKNASDASGEMIDDLTLIFNKARQSNITREISEISAGMASVS